MIIMLPESFTRYNERKQKVVYIEENMLYMKAEEIGFKRLMRELTYSIHGKGKCYSCNNEFKSYEVTVDHIIPQDLGGPTITNNLIPLCSKCNNAKTNLLPEQYEIYLKLKGSKKNEYLRESQAQNEFWKYDKNFSLLDDWVVQLPIKKIGGYKEGITYTTNSKPSKKASKKQKVKKHYEKYGRFQKAIIVDRKYRLLGGYESLMYAKKINLKEVPVIILENVEVYY